MPSTGVLVRLAVAVALVSSAQARALAQTVTGTVVDRAGQSSVGNAVVRLTGAVATRTDAAGRFMFHDLPHGTYVLSVTAIGYHPHVGDLIISGDTTLTIRLEARQVTLDTVVVNPQPVTIKGTVRDSASGLNLRQAQVTVYPGGVTEGAVSGDFRIGSASKGEQITLVVEALEHLPKRVSLTATDTTLTVLLGIDSVGLRLVQQQVRRLSTRSSSVPYSLSALDRDRIVESNPINLGELLRRRLPPGEIPVRPPYPPRNCTFLDDIPVHYELLVTLAPSEIERVEIYGFRGKMIRVYSKRYVASLMRQPRLPLVHC